MENEKKPAVTTLRFFSKEELDLQNDIELHEKIMLWMIPVMALFGAAAAGYYLDESFGLFAAMAFIFSAALIVFLCQIVQIIHKKRQLKILDCESQSPEKAKICRRRFKRRNIFALIFILILCACGIAVQIHLHHQMVTVYMQAQSLVDAGDFEQATSLLKQIKEADYRDTEALLLLCQSHMEMDAEEYSDAHFDIKRAYFRFQTPEQMKVIEEFRTSVNTKYDEYIRLITKKYLDEQKKKDEQEQLELQRKEFERYYLSGSSSYSSGSSKSGKKNDEPEEDPYYADEFADAEDFYDWYADDFDSFEDAENYYYSHSD